LQIKLSYHLQFYTDKIVFPYSLVVQIYPAALNVLLGYFAIFREI